MVSPVTDQVYLLLYKYIICILFIGTISVIFNLFYYVLCISYMKQTKVLNTYQ